MAKNTSLRCSASSLNQGRPSSVVVLAMPGNGMKASVERSFECLGLFGVCHKHSAPVKNKINEIGDALIFSKLLFKS